MAREVAQVEDKLAYHMGILAKAGGVELVRTEPRRGSTEHYYRATMRPYFADREWARLSAGDTESGAVRGGQADPQRHPCGRGG